MAEIPDGRSPVHSVAVLRHQWLSANAFELVLEKPQGFSFRAGQKVLVELLGDNREYSLASSPNDNELVLCIRFVKNGTLSSRLAAATNGERVRISDAYGFFVYRPGRAVFVATGTGVAPFVAYAKSGIRGYALIHGVREQEDLYYRDILQNSVENYVPCLTEKMPFEEKPSGCFDGRVTTYIANKLPQGRYDFYLCGNGTMIRDVTLLIDQKFSDSRMFSEAFFTQK
jgi:benzoate/toluate 1,2-dioxygenase reductase component